MKSSLIIVALAIGANADGHTDDIATYQPASDVEEHAKIDLDFRDFRTQLEQGDWDDAWAAYADGGNSVKGDGFRTLRGFWEGVDRREYAVAAAKLCVRSVEPSHAVIHCLVKRNGTKPSAMILHVRGPRRPSFELLARNLLP